MAGQVPGGPSVGIIATSGDLGELEIGVLAGSEIGEALAVVSRGMRDNPTHVAVFGDDRERRIRRVRRSMGVAFGALGLDRGMLAARRADGTIVGVCGMMPPGECLPSLGQRLRILPRLLPNGPGATYRTMRWLGAWSARDPKERHWHLGPVAVNAHLQGMGIGSRLLRAFCTRMDAAGDDAYLETDKPSNVRFYERVGFTVIDEEVVVGVPTWFMLRRAGSRG